MFMCFRIYICLGAQKNRLIETVLLSTHNICFGLEMRKLILRSLVWRFNGLFLFRCKEIGCAFEYLQLP